MFGDAIRLQPFDRILSGFDKLTEAAVPIVDCSTLSQRYQSFGVSGYRIGDFAGSCFINRYLPCSFYGVPMLIYKSRYLLPMVFRNSPEAQLLFQENHRFPSFLTLLEWELKYNFKKIVVETKRNRYSYADDILYIIDTGYLAFRLSEIIDGAAFPVSQMTSFEEFMEWNREAHLLNNGSRGRHSMILDIDNQQEKSELELILKIIQAKYPQCHLFQLPVLE